MYTKFFPVIMGFGSCRFVPVFKNYVSALFISILTYTLSTGCKFFDEHSVYTTQAVLHPISSNNQFSGDTDEEDVSMLLQASGWIEPDPFPIRIPSLYDGIVKDVYVLEGDLVKAGQKLVSLIDEDAVLALRLAETELNESASKELEILSEISLQKSFVLKAQHKNNLDQTLLGEQKDYLSRLELLPFGSIPSMDLNRSRFKADSLKFSVKVSEEDVKIATEGIVVLQNKLQSQRYITEMKRIQVEQAQLDLNRTQIFSQTEGRVLKLFASPGKRLMQKMDIPEASTAVALYRDGELQARIDVPLPDVSKLFLGQDVEITCSMLPDSKFKGRLSRISGEADLQRNTLQVKVQILNPDSRLRPEMLCRAKFFSKEDRSLNEKITASHGVFVPVSIRPKNDESFTKLWVVGRDGKTAEIREVHFGEEIINQYISILSGLNAGDQIILNPPNSLESGDSVIVIQNP